MFIRKMSVEDLNVVEEMERILFSSPWSYEDFLYDLELFLFFEYTEWIYVYNKFNLKKDERYYYYLSKANELV